jgi:hypothetical protein
MKLESESKTMNFIEKTFTLDKIYLARTALLVTLFFSVMQWTTWLPLRFWGVWGGGNFIDSWQVLRFAECYRVFGDSIYSPDSNCPGIIYGRPLLQILNVLGVGPEATQVIGFIFLMLISLFFSWILLLTRKEIKWYLILVIVISPPILLLVERANFDILIFCLLTLSCLQFIKNRKAITYLLLALTILFKYYTAPILLLLICLDRKIMTKVLGLCILFISSASVIHDIQITSTPFPDGAEAKFGATVWSKYRDLSDREWYSSTFALLINLSFFIMSLILIIFLRRLKMENVFVEKMPLSYKREILILVFGATHITCFFAGTSFDYRLIYLVSAVLLMTTTPFVSRTLTSMQVSILICILFLSYPSGGLQPLGDLLIQLQTIMLTIACYKIFIRIKNQAHLS